MTRTECARVIAQADGDGFESMHPFYPPDYRNNDRLVRDDSELAGRLFARIAGQLPDALEDDGAVWKLVGLNERFRFCRYRNGQRFGLHQDGAYARGEDERSFLTCMIYLNDAEQFEGGLTRYYDNGTLDRLQVGSVRPRAGTAIVFDHQLWHDGQDVTRGCKYVMRTDVMYRRHTAAQQGRSEIKSVAEGNRTGPWVLSSVLRGHTGYVWSVACLSEGGVATSSRDRSVRLWRPDGAEWIGSTLSEAEDGSVTALAEARAGELWTGSRDGEIRALSSSAPRVIGRCSGAVLALIRADDHVVSGTADGAVTLWHVRGERVHELRGHKGWVWGLARAPGGRLVSGGEDGVLRVWDVRLGRQVAGVDAGGPVRAVTVDDATVAVGLADGTMQLWRVDNSAQTLVLERQARIHRGSVTCIAFVGSDTVASGGEDNVVQMVDRGELNVHATLPHGAFVRCVSALGDRAVVTGSYDARARVWTRSAA